MKQFIKISLFVVMGMANPFYSPCQNNINQYEYWFDGNWGGRMITAVTPASNLNLSENIPTGGISYGLHIYNIRFKDDMGMWSSATSQHFYKLPSTSGNNRIVSYEYWIDGNYLERISQSILPQGGLQLISDIDFASIAVGLHVFNIRFKDERGMWSSAISQHFYKLPATLGNNNLVSYEYWMDANYANRVSQGALSQSGLQLISSIDVASIAGGLHVFNIRFKDERGMWSSAISQHFYKLPSTSTNNNLVSYEYWMDNNYAGKISQAIQSQSELQLIAGIDNTTIGGGLHVFNIRFKDERGMWSSALSQHFFKLPTTSGNNDLVSYEYWMDNNYAGKISKTISLQNELQLISGIDVADIAGGLHVFNIRFKDERGVWSSAISQHIYKMGNNTGLPNYINGYRYWIDTAISSRVTINLPVSTNPRYIFDQLNFASLDTGVHIITLQFRDLQKMWSSAIIDTFYQFGKPRLDNITPAKGGNIGDVTVVIKGTGFYLGTTVKLTKLGYPDINVPDSMMKIDKGQIINATFDLHNQVLGFWNLEVTVPGDTVMTLSNSFEIIPGVPATTYADVLGPGAIRINQWQTYTVTYTNRGNVDAKGVPLWIALEGDSSIQINLDFNIYRPKDTIASFYDSIPLYVDVDSINLKPFHGKVFPLIVANIPPEYTGALQFKIKVVNTAGFKLAAWMDPPFYRSPFNPGVGACIDDVISSIVSFVPVYGCAYDFIRGQVDPFIEEIASPNNGPGPLIGSYLWKTSKAALSCALELIPGLSVAKKLKKIFKGVKLLEQGSNLYTSCSPIFAPQEPIKKPVSVVVSHDPNEKNGPLGASISKFITSEDPIPYLIQFENSDSSTAPVQGILIIDSLNTSVFNLSSLILGIVHLGDTVLTPLSNGKSFTQLFDLRPNNNLVVQITADLDATTGVLKWTFTSLDPITLLPTTNPLDGFLPPNITSPEGEGSVFFSIRTNVALPNNALITNKAYIYFDSNEPIPTNDWTNTLDKIKPHSKVDSLPIYSFDSAFTVKWRGIDTSSGILNYSIYVSTNSGAYRPWRISTQDTVGTFHGNWDSTYRFYSIASDSALNVEFVPTSYDAITTVHRCNSNISIDSILGNRLVCQGSSQTYSVAPVRDATSYTWTLPSGWPGTSTADSIHAIVGASGGTISIMANTICGPSNIETISVIVNQIPFQPGAIAGNTSACVGNSQTYSISIVNGATSYTWSLPVGWTGSSTTNSINAIAGGSGGTISVRANNSCGSSADQALNITVVSAPAQPGSINGNNLVCQSNSQTYSVAAVSDATSYIWVLPSGWTGSSTTNSINAMTGASGGIISVKANNGCGSSADQTLTVTVVSAPAQPGQISGSNSVCQNSLQSYSVAAVSGAASYTWTLPAGWTGSSTTNSINVTAGPSAGTIAVKANNSCGSSTDQSLNLTALSAPTQPGQISGNITVVRGQTLDYTIMAVNGATGYFWQLTSGGSISNGQNTTTLTINWITNGNDTISVTAMNACGNSAVQKLTVTVSDPVGINNPDNIFQLKIIPNPSPGEFYLTAKGLVNKKIRIEVINTLGQTISILEQKVISNDYSAPIDLRRMPNGVYNVRILVGNKVYQRKILKQG